MTDFKSYSQCGQDSFARALIGDVGTFLDIGASHPVELSNTKGLEDIGWTGVCVEIEPSLCDLLGAERTATVIQADATQFDWYLFLSHTPEISFLSLDVDEPTLRVLQALPLHSTRFKVLTVEHDRYRLGIERQQAIRQILERHGYVCVREDVCATPGFPMEDFFVAPELEEKARGLP